MREFRHVIFLTILLIGQDFHITGRIPMKLPWRCDNLKPVEIKKDIYWLGVIDWNVRYFHGATYSTHRGTTYNSYLLMDEQPTLVEIGRASWWETV